ncbi:MAG: glycoside hydrolase family 10 protein, partial [Chitinophagaceae bacterium]
AQEAIRGTWITNVASDALHSRANIEASVALCKQKGINNIYVVVWNKGLTMHPSEVLEKYIGIRQDPFYKFDPIQTIIEVAHSQHIKVHAWFEFGFSYGYKDSTNIWMQRYPHWAGRNNKGALLQKNGFFWWNAIHPEVQELMEALVLEVVRKYDVDGIQGDDRLPAMPAEGGYDAWTKKQYKKFSGKHPPLQHDAPEWLQWKADQLSAFGKRLYTAVKKEKPGCIVSWSPSIYPWSKEQYLQDWPAWLNGGYADYIMPQLYRYDIKAYEKILKELQLQLTPEQRKRVFPGILTALGDGYLVKPEMLMQMIELNRTYGFEGECLFYFESLKKIDKLY